MVTWKKTISQIKKGLTSGRRCDARGVGGGAGGVVGGGDR